MAHLRLYWQQRGGHVHCRLYSGTRKDTTHGMNGALVFDVAEWHGGVWDAFAGIADVYPEGPALEGEAPNTKQLKVLTDAIVESEVRGYTIVADATHNGIQCHTCGRTSWHPEDVKQRFCGHCHKFHEEK